MFRTTFPRRVGRVRVLSCALVSCWVVGALASAPARAQFGDDFFDQDVPGVWIENDGNLKSRQVSPDKELAAIRARAKSAAAAAKGEKLAFVSLPKLLAEARSAAASWKELLQEVRFLGGLTQVRYVFVYPEEKDVVIAGPAEPFTVSELREVYECVWGQELDPRNFHRKVTGVPGFLEPTGEHRQEGRARPAQLYRRGDAELLMPPMMRD